MEALAFYEQHYHNAQPPGAHRGMGYPPMGYQPGYPPPAANPQAAWLGLGLGLDLTLALALLTLTLTRTRTRTQVARWPSYPSSYRSPRCSCWVRCCRP